MSRSTEPSHSCHAATGQICSTKANSTPNNAGDGEALECREHDLSSSAHTHGPARYQRWVRYVLPRSSPITHTNDSIPSDKGMIEHCCRSLQLGATFPMTTVHLGAADMSCATSQLTRLSHTNGTLPFPITLGSQYAKLPSSTCADPNNDRRSPFATPSAVRQSTAATSTTLSATSSPNISSSC